LAQALLDYAERMNLRSAELMLLCSTKALHLMALLAEMPVFFQLVIIRSQDLVHHGEDFAGCSIHPVHCGFARVFRQIFCAGFGHFIDIATKHTQSDACKRFVQWVGEPFKRLKRFSMRNRSTVSTADQVGWI
jgi:hypothetical protein